jgi:Uncharacterized protein conserved in bacteria (DUF2188)
MPGEVHVVKPVTGGWEVKGATVHATQADAIAAARRLALKRGGGEVIVHTADGRVRSRDTIGADAPRAPRAPRSEGPRTTLRLPDGLAAIADRLADELEISRNDAVLRLATRGARLYEQGLDIAARRAERWAAVVPGDVDLDALPSPDEAREAAAAARETE